MKTGMVLEGGAMRGMYTAALLDVMMEHDIKVDGVVGVSAGATFGINYKSRQIGRTLRYNLKYSKDPRYVGIKSLIKTGDLYGADFCYNELPTNLDPFDQKAFKENLVEFYVVATDVHTGKAIYHLCEHGDEVDTKWIRASASMPIVSRLVSVDGFDLLDGGIADSIPISWFRSIGYKRNIVILTRPEGYRKDRSRMFPVSKFLMRKYPKIVETMEERPELYNKTIEELHRLEKEGDTLVIAPSVDLGIKRAETDPAQLQRVYDIGIKDANDNLEAMKRFLDLSMPTLETMENKMEMALQVSQGKNNKKKQRN